MISPFAAHRTSYDVTEKMTSVYLQDVVIKTLCLTSLSFHIFSRCVTSLRFHIRSVMPYKVPRADILVCSAFSGEWSREETAPVIQFVGSERVKSDLTTWNGMPEMTEQSTPFCGICMFPFKVSVGHSQSFWCVFSGGLPSYPFVVVAAILAAVLVVIG